MRPSSLASFVTIGTHSNVDEHIKATVHGSIFDTLPRVRGFDIGCG
jgi:hypothetical protein